VKIYVAAVDARRKTESQDETQFTTKIDSSLSSNPSAPPPFLECTFFPVFKSISVVILCTTKLRVLVLCFPYFTRNSIIDVCTLPLILSINAGDLLHRETTGFSLGQISLPNFTKAEYQIHKNSLITFESP